MTFNNGKNNLPLVSICCVTYNHEPFIHESIEGFLMQKTNFPIEIIIHDDASTDKTAEIVKEYADKHPDLIVPIFQTENQYSKGISPNQTFVWPRVRGKYVAICEGDDYWIDPYKLQKQIDFLEANPEYGMVHTDFTMKHETKSEFIEGYNRKNKINIPEGEIFNDLLGPAWLIHTQTITIRTDIIRSYQHFCITHTDTVSKWLFGDIQLFLFVAKHGKVKYINYPTSVYRILEESACHSKSPLLNLERVYSFLSAKLFFIELFGVSDERITNNINTTMNKVLLRKAFITGKYKLAKEQIHLILKSSSLNIKDLIIFACTIPLINPLAKRMVTSYHKYL